FSPSRGTGLVGDEFGEETVIELAEFCQGNVLSAKFLQAVTFEDTEIARAGRVPEHVEEIPYRLGLGGWQTKFGLLIPAQRFREVAFQKVVVAYLRLLVRID